MKNLSACCLAGLLTLTGCMGPPSPAGEKGWGGPVRLLNDKVGRWLPGNRERLNAFISQSGLAAPSFDPKNRPVALFDWDNTVVKNDVGDATLFWMLAHDKVLQPADKDWGTTSRFLTPATRAALNAACDALTTDPGAPLPTSSPGGAACADEIISIYDGGKTRAGQDAWSPRLSLTLNASYAWAAQLQAGYAPEEVRAFSRAAYAVNSSNPPGTTQTVGTTSNLNWHVRVYDEMVDLIETLQENGFDVWVITASPQFVVDALAEELVGIKPHRVIGIRMVMNGSGRITPRIQGCGAVADGDDSLITYDQGKRCWVNKVIFQQPAGAQLTRLSDPAQRAVFAAGDSDTDIAFMQDATLLKLAINRNRLQIMCNAYANHGDTWLVQPMFVLPRGKGATYPCSTAKDVAGQPLVNEVGQPFTQNYEDTVYALP